MKSSLNKKKGGGCKMKRAVMFLLLTFFTSSTVIFGDKIKLINKEDLKAILENPDISIFDVRLGKDWDSSEYIIKNAVHLAGDMLESAMTSVPKDRTVVFYCA